jgi:hypothetical protein
MYAQGWTQPEIAAEYGVTQGRISQIVTEFAKNVPQPTQEEMYVLVAETCRQLMVSAMDDVQNARTVQGRSAARRDALLILNNLKSLWALQAASQGDDSAIRYVIQVENAPDQPKLSPEELMDETRKYIKALT